MIYCFLCSTLLPFQYFFWQGGIVHVLPHPKERTRGYEVVDHEQKKPRPQFSPLGDTCLNRAPFRQTVTAEFHPLGPIWQEVQDPVNDTAGDLNFLKFDCQSSVKYEQNGRKYVSEFVYREMWVIEMNGVEALVKMAETKLPTRAAVTGTYIISYTVSNLIKK